MTVGLYTIIGITELEVITYVFDSYELALLQAHENEKGVTEPVTRHPESRQKNGLRQTHWTYPTLMELVMVQELVVATEISPVTA